MTEFENYMYGSSSENFLLLPF